MGKNSWNKQSWAAEGQAHNAAGGWSYWPGSWRALQQDGKAGKGAQQGANQQKHKDCKFPAYNQMLQPATKDKDAGEADVDVSAIAPAGQTTEFLKCMQKLLNTSRKLDGKIRKAHQDKETMTKQWQEFQEKLRASFISQRQQYNADIRKAEDELLQMSQQKVEILQQIQRLVVKNEHPSGATQQALVPTKEDVEAWNELMMPTPARQREAWDDAVLQKALQAAQDPEAFLQVTLSEMAGASAGGGHMEVDQAHEAPSGAQAEPVRKVNLVTPPRRPGSLPAATPQLGGEANSSASAAVDSSECFPSDLYHYREAMRLGKDPYMTSPSFVGEVGQTSPTQEASSFGPIRTPQARELAREAAAKLLQKVVQPTIIHDDDELIDSGTGPSSNQLGHME